MIPPDELTVVHVAEAARVVRGAADDHDHRDGQAVFADLLENGVAAAVGEDQVEDQAVGCRVELGETPEEAWTALMPALRTRAGGDRSLLLGLGGATLLLVCAVSDGECSDQALDAPWRSRLCS